MKSRDFCTIAVLFAAALLPTTSWAQQYSALTLHNFGGTEGSVPDGLVAVADGSMYGVSLSGGSGNGTLFHATTDGTVTLLHAFTGADGTNPSKLIATASGDVYGFSASGGGSGCGNSAGCGVIFHYSAALGFSVLWTFTGGSKGAYPNSLIVGQDGNLYGAATGDDYVNFPVIFKLTPQGSFQVVHKFALSPVGPRGITQGQDGNFYGFFWCTNCGNTFDYIYQLTPGNVFNVFYTLYLDQEPAALNFVTAGDGSLIFTAVAPESSTGYVYRLTLDGQFSSLYSYNYLVGSMSLSAGSDGTFYGTAQGTGANYEGEAFHIDANNKVSVLYDFLGLIDGAEPAQLAQTADGRLFGVALYGGLSASCSGCGTLYELVEATAGAPTITRFDPASGPVGTSISISGSAFTGTSSVLFGPAAAGFTVQSDSLLNAVVPAATAPISLLAVKNAAGTAYESEPFQVLPNQLFSVYRFCPGTSYPSCADGLFPSSLIQGSDGNFYGTTSNPGSSLFRLTAAGQESIVASGLALPNPVVQGSDGAFYGTSEEGGYYGLSTGCNNSENPTGCGTAYTVSTTGRRKVLYKFRGQSDGAFPRSNMLQMADGSFIGSTGTDGTGGGGTLFRLTGKSLQTLYPFVSASTGAGVNFLIKDASGNVYGTAGAGGPANLGTVFEYSASGNFTLLHAFAKNEGGLPSSLLLMSDGSLLGVARQGGVNSGGIVFHIATNGSFSTVYSFGASALGSSPQQIVLGANGILYGVAYSGGALGGGTIFSMTTSGAAPTALYSFFNSSTSSTHGDYPLTLLQATSGDLYGVTNYGGAVSCDYGDGCGLVFRLH